MMLQGGEIKQVKGFKYFEQTAMECVLRVRRSEQVGWNRWRKVLSVIEVFE